MLQNVICLKRCQEVEPNVDSEHGFLEVCVWLEVENTTPEQELSHLECFRENFLCAHMRDPTLTPAREQVTVVNGKSQKPGAEKWFPHFAKNHKLLYRVS